MEDFVITCHGSIYLLAPQTPAARTWITENLSVEQHQMFGEAVAVEHRYIEDIAYGIEADGLAVTL